MFNKNTIIKVNIVSILSRGYISCQWKVFGLIINVNKKKVYKILLKNL